MQKRRLENALNAGKLIQLGFDLNKGKPEKLNLLYYVSCYNNNVVYADKTTINELPSPLPTPRKSPSTLLNRKNKTSNSSSEEDDDDDDDEDIQINNISNLNKTNDSIKNENENEEKIETLCLQFNQNLNLLATGDSNGKIQIHDIFSGLEIEQSPDEHILKPPAFSSLHTEKKFPASVVYNMPAICMKWYPYSKYSMGVLFYAHVNGFIGILEKDTMKKSIFIQEPDEISCIDFNLDSSLMACVGKDYKLKLYDSNLNSNSKFSKVIKTYGAQSDVYVNQSIGLDRGVSSTTSSSNHTNRLQAVKFSNKSNEILFTGGWDRTVKIWDIRTPNGLCDTIQGPFICGSDAIDVNDNLILTAAWVKENSLNMWDLRKCNKVLLKLPIVTRDYKKVERLSPDGKNEEIKKISNGEYLYACKFFSSSNHHTNFENNNEENAAFSKSPTKSPKSPHKIKPKQPDTNFSTVLACGSGTQSLHLIDYEKPTNSQHLASFNCKSPLYCLDAIYSCSMIACGGMRKFFTLMGASSNDVH